MEIRASLKTLSEQLEIFVEKFESLGSKQIESETALSAAVSELKQLKQAAAHFLRENAPVDLASSFADTMVSENQYQVPSFKKQGFTSHQVRNFQDRTKERSRTAKMLIEYLKTSDPLIQNSSLEFERKRWTVQQKSDFVLVKLYEVIKSERLWDIHWLLALNDIPLDTREEAGEIIQELSFYGFVEKLNAAGNLVHARITTAGKKHVQENILAHQSSIVQANVIDVDYSESNESRLNHEELAATISSIFNDRLEEIDDKLDKICSELYEQRQGKSKAEVKSWLKNKIRDEVFKGLVNTETVDKLVRMMEGGANLLGS